MNKIGLINIQRCDSHGAVLLAYALEKVLEELGYEPTNIDYKYAGRIKEKNIVKRVYLKILIVLKKKLHISYANYNFFGKNIKNEYDIQSKRFSDFRNTYLHLTKEITNPCDDVLKEFDGFVVGSDVVWKPEIVSCEDKNIYFLKSVPDNTVKVAYAASIGTDNTQILNNVSEYYENAFDNFDYLSIREKSMIDFVRKYTTKSVESVIDPVFLLKQEMYMEIEKNALGDFSERPYIYVYILGDNTIALKEANRLAKKENCSILIDLNENFDNANLLTTNVQSAISAGPLEFLYNIRNAKYVITDSFHATCFSLINNVPFTVFDRGAVSVRMQDLLKRFDIYDRHYEGKSLSIDSLPWERINEQIKDERKQGIRFLEEAFHEGFTKSK